MGRVINQDITHLMCAMMPRDKGGVVDAKFKVYGVDGLRVVDASIFPMLPRGNLQTLVYAIAERAADWIKEDIESI
jgi:choline dehydrogenase